MAQVREHDNPSSPRSSSGGAESFKGTPDTRLTAFSPDEGSSKSSKLLQGLARSAAATPPGGLPASGFGSNAAHLDKDPFVTPSHQLGTRLSPTASAFSPFVGAIESTRLSEYGPVAAALSHELGLSRHLEISSHVCISVSEVSVWLTELEARGKPLYGSRFLNTFNGHVFAHFVDIRDACSTLASISLAERGWKVDYANPAQMPQEAICREMIACNSGRVLVFANAPQCTTPLDVIQAMDMVQGLLQSHGRLFAFVRRSAFPNGSFKAVAEFCDVSAVVRAVSSFNNFVTPEGIHLAVSLYMPDSAAVPGLAGAMHGLRIGKVVDDQHQQGSTASATPRPAPAQPPFTMYPLMFQSPFGPGMPYMLDSYLPAASQGPITPIAPVSPSYPLNYSPSRPLPSFGRSEARRQNAMRISRSSYHGVASHHNHVDIHRIRDGIDVRTTIMLRNIPNKVDQAMLKRIIDESSWGKYDFMYLRIDFANDCNVGYAFINFVDFVDARGNQRWNCFKSDKVAEISYATIQGKDCLVQKFRNSSVMLEAPHYRPKLYFTSNGPVPELAGQEEPFPEPDNQSKMKRSCENAEHVGLFTPNAGQHFRDEQRRRRSQYDRGTRLAALEEYDYETAIQHMYGTAMP
ncbi:RNA recognition motif domain-containing protein [Hirsutella rhossiliensis]|uniref:RNA recognition motif domain-containing protein n=1 Tax=Hirsutella rhossiliensis TaxID=111463 RepID=A0A9P8SF96_9HYPO|nr:RNA recognition motif domain-containing protein [Hirsutella rhossiliensis]KAH0960511.1 RNA recognition motif domain-containing protein [Hirsutella rhossiliensis]